MSFLLWRSFQFKSHPHVMTTYVCRQRAVEEETKLCHFGRTTSIPSSYPQSACLPAYHPHRHFTNPSTSTTAKWLLFKLMNVSPAQKMRMPVLMTRSKGALCWLAHVSLGIYYLPDSGKQTRSSSRVSALQPSLSHSFTLLGFVVMDYDVIESKEVSRTSSSQLYC